MARSETEQERTARLADERATATPERFADGRTGTRDDPLDEGAPMPGVPGEGEAGVVGPEDAAALGEDRDALQGDYSTRQPEPHHSSELIPEDEREPGGPIARLVDQRTGEVVDESPNVTEPSE